jgi:hypothetical protein
VYIIHEVSARALPYLCRFLPQTQRFSIVPDQRLDLVRLPTATAQRLAGDEVKEARMLVHFALVRSPLPCASLNDAAHETRDVRETTGTLLCQKLLVRHLEEQGVLPKDSFREALENHLARLSPAHRDDVMYEPIRILIKTLNKRDVDPGTEA